MRGKNLRNLQLKKIGLIAGSGEFPCVFAEQAKAKGLNIVAVAFREEPNLNLVKIVHKIKWVSVGQLDKLIQIFKEEGIQRTVMCGHVAHRWFFRVRPDPRAEKVLKRLRDHRANSILAVLAKELRQEKIELVSALEWLKDLLPEEGILTRSRPTAQQWADIKFGWELAQQIAGLDIGQSIVVKEQTVVAVEAMEGTDAAFLRAGKIAGQGAVAVKVAKPQQDFRFDVPVIGPRTVAVLSRTKIKTLAITAGATLMLKKQKIIQAANRSKISIVALRAGEDPCPPQTGG